MLKVDFLLERQREGDAWWSIDRRRICNVSPSPILSVAPSPPSSSSAQPTSHSQELDAGGLALAWHARHRIQLEDLHKGNDVVLVASQIFQTEMHAIQSNAIGRAID